PTFGIEPMLGTNPFTAGVPSDEEFPFLLDCATSIIQKGKIEICNRENRYIPDGVVLDQNGNSERNPSRILNDLKNYQAALMPIGGEGGKASGYKGYGYSTLVEILSSALQEGVFLKETAGIKENGITRLKVGHFFLAINIENFIPLNKFKKNTGKIMRTLRKAKKAPGRNRIFTAGEKEYEAEFERKKIGIPINKSIQNDIKLIQKELKLNKYKFSF
ncbi:MAG: Ldh family oxidoreductase, partial [Candidatus Lokiarchaeota archaeon]|nr:Ldh family oxidoreductase [Candidatus Lokiarchaeota archaeon]